MKRAQEGKRGKRERKGCSRAVGREGLSHPRLHSHAVRQSRGERERRVQRRMHARTQAHNDERAIGEESRRKRERLRECACVFKAHRRRASISLSLPLLRDSEPISRLTLFLLLLLPQLPLLWDASSCSNSSSFPSPPLFLSLLLLPFPPLPFAAGVKALFACVRVTDVIATLPSPLLLLLLLRYSCVSDQKEGS